VEKSESGIAGAVDQAADFLRGAGAVAVFLALVLSPLIVLAILAWPALRARSRRIEARLLDEPHLGTPTRSSWRRARPSTRNISRSQAFDAEYGKPNP